MVRPSNAGVEGSSPGGLGCHLLCTIFPGDKFVSREFGILKIDGTCEMGQPQGLHRFSAPEPTYSKCSLPKTFKMLHPIIRIQFHYKRLLEYSHTS